MTRCVSDGGGKPKDGLARGGVVGGQRGLGAVASLQGIEGREAADARKFAFDSSDRFSTS